jgi:hypothetical protein
MFSKGDWRGGGGNREPAGVGRGKERVMGDEYDLSHYIYI